MRLKRIFAVALFSLGVFHLTPSVRGQSAPTVLDPNFSIEVYTTGVPAPSGLAFAPPASAFGSDLYVSSAPFSGAPAGGELLPDEIYRISEIGPAPPFPATFFVDLGVGTAADSVDPFAIEFPPSGSAFGDLLYISANNLDGGFHIDCGGRILHVDSSASLITSFTPAIGPCNVPFSEPSGFEFGPGGAFGIDIYLADGPQEAGNAANLFTVSPDGADANDFGDSIVPFVAGIGDVRDVAFGPGGAFGTDLYLSEFFTQAISIADSTGAITPFVSFPSDGAWDIEFGPGGAFGDDLYAVVGPFFGNRILRITSSGVVSTLANGFAGIGFFDALEFSPDGSCLFVADHEGSNVYRICAANPDSDGDGVPNVDDNCPGNSNSEQTDTDLDGAGDACDDDDDDDGVPDGDDNCPFNANPGQLDLDNDGLGDVCDADPDGDGIVATDNCPLTPNPFQTDSDLDGAGDACDDDDDNDGICDTDQTVDGCVAGPDNCATVANADQADLDGDGIGNACDADLDDDGIDNEVDNCPELANAAQDDTDFDGDGDACDADDDNDSIPDDNDNCPLVANLDQTETDGDGDGDACDGDLDGDGVGNDVDNCPNDPNSSQNDLDGDGIGDACAPDIDGDGVTNENDVCAGTAAGMVVNPGTGCSIVQLCPCEGPRGTNQPWRNHGKYVSCVAHAADDFLELGLITTVEKNTTVGEAGQSDCGKEK